MEMGMASVATLTTFRMPSLQNGLHGHYGESRSFRAQVPRVHIQVNSVGQRSSHVHQCEKLAIHGCSFSRQENRRPVVVRSLEETSSNFDSTNFFLGELVEAKSTVEKLAEPAHPWQEEGTSPLKEDEESEKPPETYPKSKSKRLEKLPAESNGPPMTILQPYLKAESSKEEGKQKLRQLPLPMPHKVRPAGLPRPSLRRRFGIAFSRKSVLAGQKTDSIDI
ncbi:unnamed protein product [Calypogeia fissa]